MKSTLTLSILLTTILLSGCGSSDNETKNSNDTNTTVSYQTNEALFNTRNLTPLEIDFVSTTPINNKAAYITSQCYTKTLDESGTPHNPCFSCHIDSKAPNYINDWDIQIENGFGEYSKVNRNTNLFKDRTDLVSQISDAEILSYVRENNYMQEGQILLANRLKNLPTQWDINNDGKWNGYTPDCYFNFDKQGFDKAADGNYTGWRAFAYYPFLGTFWPTNGSTDDVLIRLAEDFRLDAKGVFNLEVYKLNLSIVESLIKQKDISIDAVDENLYGVDLNHDGTLGITDTIVFQWEQPTYESQTGKITNFSMSYVGLAKERLSTNEYLIAPGLYPKDTEFLHSVRYIDKQDDQNIQMAPRMKELRYGKKIDWITYPELSNSAQADAKEKDDFPDRVRTIIGNSEYGALNNSGWIYQGFIEDAKGELRPQNYEETLYCIGCHSGIGAIADSTFVFQRKFDKTHFQEGWYHWTQDANGLKNIAEPKTPNNQNEYSLYLEVNHAGDEFRTNDEVIDKFFDANGSLKQSELDKLSNDISHLLYPSVTRALNLNKAYKIIVEEQSFIYGRDAHIKPVTTVYETIENLNATGILTPIKYY